MNGPILVVTDEFDPHVDVIAPLLEDQGATVARLHPRSLMSGSVALSITGDGTWSGFVRTSGGRLIDLDTVEGVWWRKPLPPTFPSEFSDHEREFASRECTHLLHGLYGLLSDRYWMSPRESIRLAGYKVRQLVEASRLGFLVPRTIVTTDPDEARNFVGSCPGGAIYKAMANPMLTGPWVSDHARTGTDTRRPLVLMTTLVDLSKPELLEGVRGAPCLLQEYIPKVLEYRVTVIGDEAFAAEIYSQDNAATMIDWRNLGVETRFSEANLPYGIEARCIELVHLYGLEYGAIDLILTPGGDVVFLEINPNGQWLFVELNVPTLRMREALTSRILDGCRLGKRS